MQQALKKLNFQIILESEEVEGPSTHWQKQCKVLYDSIRKNLPKGSIDSANRKSETGEKAGIIQS